MSTTEDHPNPPTRVTARFKSFRLADDEVVIYDAEVDDGWIQSDLVFELPSGER
jgi:hypothetical protein